MATSSLRPLNRGGDRVCASLHGAVTALACSSRGFVRLSSAWRRAVLAAPAVSVELEVLAEATLLHVVTDNAALQRVAELIVARRENAVLRGLRGQFAAVCFTG